MLEIGKVKLSAIGLAFAFSMLIGGISFSAFKVMKYDEEYRLAEAERVLEITANRVQDVFASVVEILDHADKVAAGRNPEDIPADHLQALFEQISHWSMAGYQLRFWNRQGRGPLPLTIREQDIGDIADREIVELLSGNRSREEIEKRAILGSETIVSVPVVDRISGQWVVPVVRAIKGRDGIVGFLSVTVPASLLIGEFSKLLPNRNDVIFIFRNDGMGMFRYPFDERFQGRMLPNALIWQNYPASPYGRFRGVAATDGIERVGAHHTLSPLPLVVGMSFEIKALRGDTLQRFIPALSLVGVMLAILVVISGYLLLTLKRVLASERNQNFLAAKLAAVTDSANDGIILLNRDLTISMFNKSAERIFRVSAADMIGKSLNRLLPQRSREAHDGLMRKMLAEPDGARNMGNWRKVFGILPDGAEIPLMVAIGKITVHGEPVLSAIIRDMSDVREREQQLNDLLSEQKRLRRLAEQASNAKSMFLATMSHELRTPLNAIIGFSETIEREMFGPIGSTKYKDYIRDILSSGRHLLSLISDILDLTRLQDAKNRLDIVRLDVAEAVEDALLYVRDKAKRKDVALRIMLEHGRHFIRGDERAVRQVLTNILSNAVKYSRPGEPVDVSSAAAGDTLVRIQIRDRGPGMKQSMIEAIGEPFLQDRNSYDSSDEGTGLGLAIVKGLMQAQGGRLNVENAEGGGLVVELEFPAA